MPGISINCSGVMPASFSTLVMPAASIFSMVLGPTPASAVNGVVGAVRAVICSSISRRFSSSLLMSMSQPMSFLAKGHGLFAVGNDVDFFAAQFADNGLHAHALHAHAGAHGFFF